MKELQAKEKDENYDLKEVDTNTINFDNMRIWRYAETYSWDIENKLVKSMEGLKLGEYSSQKDPNNEDLEMNCGEVFPGLNMDLWGGKKIGSLAEKATAAGRLCTDA